MADKLLAWRGSLETRFRFDPAKAIDPREIMRVEQEVLIERRRLEERFRLGFAELKQVHAQILAARQHMMRQVIAAQTAYLQAEADLKAARGSA
jgi:DNA-binding helix-hairpin-helix protein with protein kinase domain